MRNVIIAFPWYVHILSIFDLSVGVCFQANIYSREGRVMIFDLVEAAQEFLSEIAPATDSTSTVS